MRSNPEEKKIGRGAYVIGGLSYIPLIGVIFGIIAIIWGLAKYKKGGRGVVIVGTGGILFTIIIYSGLFYFGFMKRGGVFDDLRQKSAKWEVTKLVETIEFYKLQHGHYPESLEVLAKSASKNNPAYVHDPTQINISDNTSNAYFYYEVIDDGNAYYLLSVGTDKKPFTADDILPDVDTSKSLKIGLKFHSDTSNK